jgi:hypothetical protein
VRARDGIWEGGTGTERDGWRSERASERAGGRVVGMRAERKIIQVRRRAARWPRGGRWRGARLRIGASAFAFRARQVSLGRFSLGFGNPSGALSRFRRSRFSLRSACLSRETRRAAPSYGSRVTRVESDRHRLPSHVGSVILWLFNRCLVMDPPRKRACESHKTRRVYATRERMRHCFPPAPRVSPRVQGCYIPFGDSF